MVKNTDSRNSILSHRSPLRPPRSRRRNPPPSDHSTPGPRRSQTETGVSADPDGRRAAGVGRRNVGNSGSVKIGRPRAGDAETSGIARRPSRGRPGHGPAANGSLPQADPGHPPARDRSRGIRSFRFAPRPPAPATRVEEDSGTTGRPSHPPASVPCAPSGATGSASAGVRRGLFGTGTVHERRSHWLSQCHPGRARHWCTPTMPPARSISVPVKGPKVGALPQGAYDSPVHSPEAGPCRCCNRFRNPRSNRGAISGSFYAAVSCWRRDWETNHWMIGCCGKPTAIQKMRSFPATVRFQPRYKRISMVLSEDISPMYLFRWGPYLISHES